MNNKISKTSAAILAMLALMLLAASPVWAVPNLQIYIPGAEYNIDTESWMLYDDDFSVLVAGSDSGNTASLTDLKLHIGVPTNAPEAWDGPSNWLLEPEGGEVSIEGPISGPNGNPHISDILTFNTDTDHGTPSELKGTPEPWPGYFQSVNLPEMDFTQNNNLDAIPNFEPGYDPAEQGSGQGFIYEFEMSYQDLFGVHLDVTGLQTKNNGNTNEVFAPYSHNADAPVHTQTPEPGTMLLFGTGLIGLAWVGRRQLQRRKDVQLTTNN